MKAVTKFEANDGRIFSREQDAVKHDLMLANVATVMQPLGSSEKADSAGWIQHAPLVVANVKRGLVQLMRPIFATSYLGITKAIDSDPDSIHPRSVVGRILDDMDSPINDGWRRLGCIDDQGREHNQPYFAINGPHADMVCREDRR